MLYRRQSAGRLPQALTLILGHLLLASPPLMGQAPSPTPAPTVQERVDHAFQLLNKGATQDALIGFQTVLEADQDNLQARLGEAMIFNKLERYPKPLQPMIS